MQIEHMQRRRKRKEGQEERNWLTYLWRYKSEMYMVGQEDADPEKSFSPKTIC
jgi:hypothetical protein